MTAFDPRDSIGFHCSLTYRAFARALDKLLQGTGVSPSQFFALAHLTVFGAMPQSELAAHLSTSPVSVVKLIDRMERDGWVERRASPEDRRVNQVVLTPQAKAVWSDLKDQAQSVVRQAYQGISTKEIENLKKTLNKIRENLES
jgi:MarR family transcriptional regulator for hemolysin